MLGSHRDVRGATKPADVAGPVSCGREGFGDFYRREYDRAVRLGWLLTSSQAAAEDVVQDAMTGVYRSFDRIDSPSAYLRRAVVNGARSRARNERRQHERLARLKRERPPTDSADAELLEAIAGLPYRQRVVIVARYWAGWSEAEIAQALRCRPGTVKSLASRALTRLRKEVHQ
jgi:RNA polymerase sigma factor (sigma-70 family)